MTETLSPTPASQGADGRPRARGLGVPFDGDCGALNAVTDVPGVEVGYRTLNEGEGATGSVAGEGPVRTGVTALFPRGRGTPLGRVWAGMSSFNGDGEMTGAHWIREGGSFLGPVLITNTHGVGMAHHAAVKWLTRRPDYDAQRALWLLPVVAETSDARLNDMNGLHVGEADVVAALEAAHGGPVAEGNVGGGTGMICYDFKGGTGTASRRIELGCATYHVGALVQANFGRRRHLLVRGVPVGRLMREDDLRSREQGSIIVVVATDAPLLPVQLQRVARRAGLGMARTGTAGGTGSGDIFLAFSTAGEVASGTLDPLPVLAYIPNDRIDPVFEAAVEAVEEAILNALIAAETMTGWNGNRVIALDHDRLREILRAHGRLNGAA
jgi:D-aminopeptidase